MSACLRVHVQVYAWAWVCGYAHLVPALYEDPTSLRADNCTYTVVINIVMLVIIIIIIIIIITTTTTTTTY
jgi:uncharacterized integral membrane protein